MGPVKTVVLYGDSMLGRFTKARIAALETQAGVLALNCAAGGWTSTDGAHHAEYIARIDPDVVVLSFGANDCAPDRLVDLRQFGANLRSIVSAFPRSVKVAFLPPSVVEVNGIGPRGRTNRTLSSYRETLRDAVSAVHAVETDRALATLTADGVEVHEDGLHLNSAGYDVVITALAEAIRTVLKADTAELQ